MLNKTSNLKIQNNFKSFGILVLFYLLTIMIALPEKFQPIGKRHQDLIAHQLITYNIWNQSGFWHYNGGLILTYPNIGDFNLKSDPIQTGKNSKGEYYYFSYPPFSFYSTYFILKFFHLSIDEFSIRWIASFFFFLNILGLLLIFKHNFLIPLLSYIFLPNVLWFHHNVWFLDIQVTTFILYAIYFSKENILGFVICILGACFTDWWGLLFTFSFLMVIKISEFYNIPNDSILYKNLKFQFLTIVASISAFLAFVSINVNLVGFHEFYKGLMERFISRIGLDTQHPDYFFRFDFKTYIFIAWYYVRNYLPILLLLGIFYFLLPRNNKVKTNSLPLFTLFFSIFFHHLILLNWTAAHDFSVLKFSILIPFITDYIGVNLNIHQKKWFIFGIIVVIFIQIIQYFRHINVPRNLQYVEIAQCIKQEYKPDETAKANYYHQPIPYLWWKSERNVIRDSTSTKCNLF